MAKTLRKPRSTCKLATTQVGIIALALAVSPELSNQGGYWLIPGTLHTPLAQGFIITKRAEGNMAARRFADFMSSQAARVVMGKYGFTLPGEVLSQ
jgi:molybdate transport system substrate-binding protein